MVADECRVVSDCPALSGLREDYRQLFTLAELKMPSFSWQRDMHLVAKFVVEVLQVSPGIDFYISTARSCRPFFRFFFIYIADFGFRF